MKEKKNKWDKVANTFVDYGGLVSIVAAVIFLILAIIRVPIVWCFITFCLLISVVFGVGYYALRRKCAGNCNKGKKFK